MSRSVAGLACRIRVPVRQYQAVALLVGASSHVIRLMHRDASLSLDIEEFANFATAEDYRERLAGFLDLPQVIVAGAPDEAESLVADATVPRRHRAIRARRPRFLTRRRSGEPVAVRKVEGREIIARR